MPNLNALRHGCCAEEIIILPHEKLEDFKALTKQYQNTYENLGEFEQDLLHHAILSEWLHIRATKEYLETVAYLYEQTPIQVEWTDEQHKKLNRALRYKTKHSNDVKAHLKHLESFKRARKAEVKEAAAVSLKKETVQLKIEQQKTKQMKLEKKSLVTVLMREGLLRSEHCAGLEDEK